MCLCSICESRSGLYRCICCNRFVCEKDYVVDKKICRICSEALCEICGRYLSMSKCYICGRNCCEDCLVQITLVQYICIDCFEKYWKTSGE